MTRGYILFLACLLVSFACRGATVLQASPESVQLCPGGTEYVRIVATTDEDASLAKSIVRWRSSANIDVALETVVPSAPNNASLKYASWLLKLTSANGSPAPGTVHVFLVDEAAPQPLVLASTSFKVQSAIATEAFPAKVELDSTWTSVNEGQSARAQAIVTNQSATPLSVTGVRVTAQPFDVADPESEPAAQLQKAGAAYVLPVANQEIAPGSVLMRSFDLFVNKDVRPSMGNHRVQLAVDVTGTVNGCQRAVTLVANKELGFAVLGNESVLTAVGIPSFLLVPGFLMLMAMVVLWRLGVRPRRVAATAEFPFPPKKEEFWVLAITLSLLLVLVPSAPGRLANYRIEDVAQVWLASLVGAGVVYLIIICLINVWDAASNAKLLAEDDTVEAALRKLTKLTKSTLLTAVDADLTKAKLGAGTERRLLPKRTPGLAWTVPPVVYDWKGEPDADTLAAIEAARTSQDLQRLVDVLLNAVAQSQIVLKWQPGASVRRPVRIASDAITENGEAELILESE